MSGNKIKQNVHVFVEWNVVALEMNKNPQIAKEINPMYYKTAEDIIEFFKLWKFIYNLDILWPVQPQIFLG